MINEPLIFSNKMADIYLNASNKKMIVIYHGLVDYDLFLEIIKSINQVATETGICGALVDISELRGSFHRLLDYMEETGFPLLVEQGLKFQAQIISDDLMMQNLSKKIEKLLTSLGVNLKTFTNRAEGEEWLNGQLANKG
ncbi:MAG: hypothetical protein L3J06_01545 [Cyclobacteriaceae bacterium]|nr:hypothetical protein [Cyclobacteriaceae bacterium]